MFELNGKTAIIAGSTYGMGLVIARTFARQGAQVLVTGRKTDLVEKTVKEIKADGGDVRGFPVDLLVYQQAYDMVAKAVAEFGKVDVLVNVVGGGFRKMFLEYTEADWDYMINFNLKTMFNSTQAAAKQMVKQGKGGSIISISSLSAWIPNWTMSAYCAAKAAVVALSLTLMQELGPHNIRVNCIEPGFIETQGARDLSPDFDKLKARRVKTMALGRYGKPEDVAAAAVYLASDEASFMTGRELRLDGGYGLKPPHFLDQD